jgi:hypothetical protein
LQTLTQRKAHTVEIVDIGNLSDVVSERFKTGHSARRVSGGWPAKFV